MHIFDLVEQRQEVGKLFREQFLHRGLGGGDNAEDFREHVALGKPNFLRINSCARHYRIDQILLIFAVHNCEPARVTERAAVAAQHPVTDRVKCAAPKSAGIDRQQIRDAIEHLPRGFVREREQQNVARINSVLE